MVYKLYSVNPFIRPRRQKKPNSIVTTTPLVDLTIQSLETNPNTSSSFNIIKNAENQTTPTDSTLLMAKTPVFDDSMSFNVALNETELKQQFNLIKEKNDQIKENEQNAFADKTIEKTTDTTISVINESIEKIQIQPNSNENETPELKTEQQEVDSESNSIVK